MPAAHHFTTHPASDMRIPPFSGRHNPTLGLPPAPSIEPLHEAAIARLDALTRDVLPKVRLEREFLYTVWHSEAPDAHVLYLSDDICLTCDPIGADRLATVLATEEALVSEASSLRDLSGALADYAVGGRQVRSLLDDPNTDEDLTRDAGLAFRRISAGPMPAAPSPPEPTSQAGRAYTRRLLRYLAEVERDADAAAAAGRAAEVEHYSLERDAVRQRLAVRLEPTTNPTPNCLSQRGSPIHPIESGIRRSA